MIQEAHIIQLLKTQFPSHIGDDAAVLPLSDEESYVITQDALVEDVHFRLRYSDVKSLAHKALHVNLSDLAAMGATPCYILMSLSVPEQAKNVTSFLHAFSKACKTANVILVGGDTTHSPRSWFINVTAIGKASTPHLKYRSTGKPDDIVCSVGRLGYAHIGLTALEHQLAGFKPFKQACLKPNALIEIGAWLGQQQAVHSMMDLSDGLYIDLARLCKASNLGATLKLDALPSPALFIKACKRLKLDPINTILTGGEDYGLLFSVSAEAYTHFASAYIKQFDLPLHQIGFLTEKHGVRFTEQGQKKKLKLKPFSHFGE